MKNTLKYLVGICLLSCFSCQSYLDLKPYGEVIPETAEEFAALLHAHLNTIDNGTDNCIVGSESTVLDYEAYADNLDASLTIMPQGRNLKVYIGSSLNGLTTNYRNLYACIRNCNLIIGNLKERETEEGEEILGTAYTLRGVCYYNLLRLFCEPYDPTKAASQLGLPLVAEFDMEARPIRSGMKETIRFIEEDLKKGISFHTKKEIYRFTEDVAKFYLTRLYFWGQEWQEIVPVAKELMAAYPLLEGEEYVKMLQDSVSSNGATNVLLKAHVQSDMSGDMSAGGARSLQRYRPVSKEFVNLFEDRENDIRYTFSFDSKRVATKYLAARLRTAEVMLMLMEAYAHLNDTENALACLNELRSKRYKTYTPYTLNNLPEVNPEELIQVDATGAPLTELMAAILKERRKELFLEGDRWFELKRNGRPEFWVASNGLRYQTQKFMYTAPIYFMDVVLTPGLIQNEGYE